MGNSTAARIRRTALTARAPSAAAAGRLTQCVGHPLEQRRTHAPVGIERLGQEQAHGETVRQVSKPAQRVTQARGRRRSRRGSSRAPPSGCRGWSAHGPPGRARPPRRPADPAARYRHASSPSAIEPGLRLRTITPPIAWASASTPQSRVGAVGRSSVSSGSTSACWARISGWAAPRLRVPTVTTAPPETSEPVPDVVGTVTSGSAGLGDRDLESGESLERLALTELEPGGLGDDPSSIRHRWPRARRRFAHAAAPSAGDHLEGRLPPEASGTCRRSTPRSPPPPRRSPPPAPRRPPTRWSIRAPPAPPPGSPPIRRQRRSGSVGGTRTVRSRGGTPARGLHLRSTRTRDRRHAG